MQKISNLFKSEIFFFSFIFLIFFALQAKSLTTGDGGELIGATFGLGVAHPSGYPLYLLLGKLFTFLPLGNIPLKVVLVSSLSSAIILTLIFSYLKNHYSFYTGLFATLLLLSSYSFVGQSLIAKFYPLNTLLILIIFYLGLKNLEEYEVKDQLIISFLLGIALSLHHTTFLMFIPLIIPFISNFKNAIKNMFFSILFFLLGSSSTLYILIRSQKPTLINLSPSLNFSGLIYTLLRKAYNKGASTEVAKKLIYLDLDKILSTIKNMFLLLKSQFHIYSFIFFILGILFIVSNKKIQKKGVYLILSFIAYSIILGYLTFSSPKPDIDAWYIAGHQYFLPAFVFYALICALGFLYAEIKIQRLAPLFLLFPLIYIPNNLILNNYDTNDIAKYKTIDSLFIKPVKSIIIFSGDNDVFQGWYQKNVEKFRDDICIISAPMVEDKVWGINNGCNHKIYADSYPEIYKSNNTLNLAKITDYMYKFRVYSSFPIENNKNLCPYLKSYYSALDFLVLPKKAKLDDQQIHSFNKSLRNQLNKFAHYNICIKNQTDDLFSMALCHKYSTLLVFLAKDISDSQLNSGKRINIKLNFGNTNYDLNIPINKHTSKFLFKAKTIEEYNNLKNFYLYEENNN